MFFLVSIIFGFEMRIKNVEKKQLIMLKDLIPTIKSCNFDILLTAGAGSIGVEAAKIPAALAK